MATNNHIRTLLKDSLKLFSTIERVKRGWKPPRGTVNHVYTKVLRLQAEARKGGS